MKETQGGRQVEVLLPAAVPHGFDYRVPDGMTLAHGDIVSVPFGKGESLGVVWKDGVAEIAPGKIKTIRQHFAEYLPLSEPMRRFIDWAAWYNCASPGLMLKMALPIADIARESSKKLAAAIEAMPLEDMALAALSPLQAQVAAALEQAVGNGFHVTLLDGVTGSGKTEVYFDAVAHALKQDPANQVLVLLPEIALSVQWLERFTRRFGHAPVLWHSEVTPARKRAAWQAIAKGTARVIVGARSALFLPYRKLALLVIDEEHDTSYKQEEGVIYHARDMAVARARFEQLPVVLVSATPSLESYYNARQGKYKECSLPARHGVAEMPEITLIDMRQAPLERGRFISDPLRRAVAEAVASGHQAMLFLNRRGYAPLLLCRACGHRFQCAECSAWLVLHGRYTRSVDRSALSPPHGGGQQAVAGGNYKERLECHHCGFRMPVPPACPACAAEDSLHACGPGVERLQEEVADFLPQARIAVMASDSMGGVNELSDVISAMMDKKIDILIGTQMIAKGHHFADLAVVGVVDADLGLGGGDLRAAEKTYQLLHQLSGRAGREATRGAVYLQSYLPEHPVMKALLSGERTAFMEAELAARDKAHMPPFARLAALVIEGEKEDGVVKIANQLAATAVRHSKIRVLGPVPAPLFLLRGKFRYRLLVQAERSINLPDYMQKWVDAQAVPSSIRVKIDMDPVSFM